MKNLPRHKKINILNMGITTHCSRRCPECCCGMPTIEHPEHVPLETIRQVTEAVSGITSIVLTGGEPMLHPQIESILTNIRAWSRCSRLWVATNGEFPSDRLELLKMADEVHFSLYDESNVPGYPSNKVAQQRLIDFCKSSPNRPLYHGGHPSHKALHPHGTKVCRKSATGLIASANGLFYGCCVAPGVPGAIGVELSHSWREELMNTLLPCHNCRFGAMHNV